MRRIHRAGLSALAVTAVVGGTVAFKALDKIYGTTTKPSELKKDFLLPSNLVSQADLSRLINSSEIQSVLEAPKGGPLTKRAGVQKNPLRNKQVMLRFNPYHATFVKNKVGQQKAGEGKPPKPPKTFLEVLRED